MANDMKGNLGALLKQAQEMQAKMQQAQEELANTLVTGEAGGGLVRITINGRYNVKKVFIEPSLLKEEKEVLEDLIVAAFNDAVRKIEETSRGKLAGLAAGLQLPGGMGDLFGGGGAGQDS